MADDKGKKLVDLLYGQPSIRPTEVRSPAALGLGQALQKGHEFVSKPFGYPNPPAEAISEFLGVPAIARTLERLGYGEPLTTGRGMTTKPKEDTVEALLSVAPLLPATKGVPVGTSIKSKGMTAAEKEAAKARFLEESAIKERLFHGTFKPDLTEFKTGKTLREERYPGTSVEPWAVDNRNAVFLTPEPEFAGRYSGGEWETGLGYTPTTYPVHVQVKNPWDYDNPEHIERAIKAYKEKYPLQRVRGAVPSHESMRHHFFETNLRELPLRERDNWSGIEKADLQEIIQDLGHDAFFVKEAGVKNLGVYDPRKIKSAISNRGTYDVTDPDITKAGGGEVHMDKGGAAFGVFPQMKPRRSRQDPEASKQVPVDLARGVVAGALGMPGDVESLIRLLPGLSEETILPTSEDILKRIPGGSDTPASRAAATMGTLLGGGYTGPGSGARAVTAVPGAVKRAAQDFAMAAAESAPKMFIGPKAKTWNKAAADAAERLEKAGMDPVNIWRQTGTFRGADGILRQEISDVAAKHRNPKELRELGEEKRAEARTLKERIAGTPGQKDLFPKALTEAKRPAREDVKRLTEEASELMRHSDVRGQSARFALEHPELYEAYPELAKVPVYQGGLGTFGERGSLRGGAGDMELSVTQSGLRQDPRSTLLHEMQHAVQTLEGMAPGGNTALAFQDPKAFDILTRMREEAARPMPFEEYVAKVGNFPDVQKRYDEYVKNIPSFVKAIDNELQQKAAMEYYKRLSGEAEARATQARQTMGPTERKQEFPYSSYDVLPEDLIVKSPKGSTLQASIDLDQLRSGGIEIPASGFSKEEKSQLRPLYQQGWIRVEERDGKKMIVPGRGAWYEFATPEQQSALDTYQKSSGVRDLSLMDPTESLLNSAQASFFDFEIVPGVRNIPIKNLEPFLPGYESGKELKRIEDLAGQIKESKQIEPLFIGLDPTGVPYIMEGQHRIRALKSLGYDEVPARVVVDMDDITKAKGGSVHISNNPDTMRLELAGGGSISKLAKLLRAPAKTRQEIEAIAERMAPQVTGEYVREKPGSAKTVAGKTAKQFEREKNLPVDIRATSVERTPEKIDVEKLKDQVAIGIAGDPTVTGKTLYGVGETRLASPAPQHGGPLYGLYHDQDHFWASGLGAARKVQNLARQASQQYDAPVLGNYIMMGPDSINYAQHFADANLQAIDLSKMTAKQVEGFNNLLRKGSPASGPRPSFPGVEDKGSAYLHLAFDPELRKYFNQLMQQPTITEKFGLPSGQDIRFAITEPELQNLERGATGFSMGRMNPEVKAKALKLSEHPTYSHDIPGEFIGQTKYPIPYELSFPDTLKAIRENPKQAPHEFGSLKMVGPRQIIDQQLIDEIKAYEDRMKALTGKKKGGSVKKADGGEVTIPDMTDGGKVIDGGPFKKGGKVQFTDNLDTMRLAVGRK